MFPEIPETNFCHQTTARQFFPLFAVIIHGLGEILRQEWYSKPKQRGIFSVNERTQAIGNVSTTTQLLYQNLECKIRVDSFLCPSLSVCSNAQRSMVE